jgi:hypothetical protein
MPRWGGSYGEVDNFIQEMVRTTSAERASEMYARLYSVFATMEGDETDVFKDAYARWPQMKQGYQDMVSRYPRSEWTRNAYAAFACIAGDAQTYGSARSAIKKLAQPAWTSKHSPAICDKRLRSDSADP